MTEHGLRLGAISYKLAPLYAYWRPHLKGWLALPVVVLALYFWILRRTRVATSLTDRWAIAFFSLSSIAISTSVSMLDGGPRSLIAPLLRTDLEYYGAIDRVHGVGDFLRDYPQQARTMPMHAQVHPPGAILFVWAMCNVFGGGPWAAAAGIIVFSSLAVPVVYRWAERLGGPGVARRAAAIFVLTPSIVLFTATSMDGPFAVLLIATMWLFWESLEHLPIRLGLLAGLAGAAAAVMTYSVTVALLFCGIATCARWFAAPQTRRSTLVAAVSALVGFNGLHLVFWLTTGYDPVQMFLAAITNSNHIMSGTRHESPARYVHIAVANLVVFFVAAGLPCAAIWWPTMLRSIRSWLAPLQDSRTFEAATPNSSWPCVAYRHRSASRPEMFLVTSFLTLFIAASVPVYVLEVERVWMFLVPLVVIPVASRLFEQERGTGKINDSMAVAILLGAQTILTEVLLTTYW
jgi:4-amino-4-deoxy-L-arabinose transferase-like glycosyltransferase